MLKMLKLQGKCWAHVKVAGEFWAIPMIRWRELGGFRTKMTLGFWVDEILWRDFYDTNDFKNRTRIPKNDEIEGKNRTRMTKKQDNNFRKSHSFRAFFLTTKPHKVIKILQFPDFVGPSNNYANSAPD